MNINDPMQQTSSQPNAVSLYGQDSGLDEFPVLKAFQQYIDAEQAKARKRLLILGAFSSVLIFVLIAIFVSLLIVANERNQMLNDRLVEYAMKDRERVSPQFPTQMPQHDNSAILALTEKLETTQKKLYESQRESLEVQKAAQEATQKAEAERERSAQAVREANERAVAAQAAQERNATRPNQQELEIKRLKELLAREREKTSVEKEKQRQAEIEAYRRKHYPELYEIPNGQAESSVNPNVPQSATSLKATSGIQTSVVATASLVAHPETRQRDDVDDIIAEIEELQKSFMTNNATNHQTMQVNLDDGAPSVRYFTSEADAQDSPALTTPSQQSQPVSPFTDSGRTKSAAATEVNTNITKSVNNVDSLPSKQKQAPKRSLSVKGVGGIWVIPEN